MKIVLVGAIGKQVLKTLIEAGHEVIKVGKTQGDFQVDITRRESVRPLLPGIHPGRRLESLPGLQEVGHGNPNRPSLQGCLRAARGI